MLERLLRLLYRHRTITLVTAAVAMVAGLILAQQISVNDSPERWLPASSVDDWDRFAEHFEYSDSIAIGIEFDNAIQDSDLAFVKQFRNDLLAVEGIKQVIDVSVVADRIEGVPLTVLLKPPAPGEDDPYEMFRGTLFDDPSLQPEGTTGRTLLSFVLLETIEDLDDLVRRKKLDALRRNAVSGAYEAFEKHHHTRPDVNFHMIGGVVIQDELEEIARRLVVTILPLSLMLTLLALGIGFRSLSAVLVAVMGSAWSISVMLGGVSLAGWDLNVVTVGGPTLMIVIVLATTIHVSHYYSAHQAASFNAGPDSTSRHGRPSHFIRWVAVPCLGASIITGVGFLMLAFNELSPARELGIELFFGAVLAFFGVLLMWLLLHPLNTSSGRLLSPEALERLYRRVSRRPAATVLIIVAVLAFLGYTSSRVRVDADPFSFFQPQSRIAKSFAHFSDRKFGLYVVDVVLVPKSSRSQEDQLARLELERSMQRLDGGPTDGSEGSALQSWQQWAQLLRPIPRTEEEEADRQAALEFENRIEAREEVRKAISTISIREKSPPVTFGLNLFTDLDALKNTWRDVKRKAAHHATFRDWTADLGGRGALRVSFMVYDTGTGFRPLLEEIREAMPSDRFEWICTGTAVNVEILSEHLVGGITRGLITALCIMALLCAVLFRSLRLTLISVLPNTLPVVIVFGVMGLFDVPLNSGSAMVTTIALGVGLNDTVHFVMHYRRRRTAGENVDEALDDTFAEVGRPIVLTSVVNCVGFAMFLLSDFRPLYHFGMLASVAMAAALVGDLILLPNLLKLFDQAPYAKDSDD